MKSAIAAIALTTLAAAAPIGTAQAETGVTIRVDTPEFGIRIGTPVRIYAPVPVYAPPPVYVPAPVYVPPPVYVPRAPVVFVPPRVVVQPGTVYRVVEPYPYRAFGKPWKVHPRHRRHDDFRGYAYARD